MDNLLREKNNKQILTNREEASIVKTGNILSTIHSPLPTIFLKKIYSKQLGKERKMDIQCIFFCLVNYLYLLSFQVEEAANNWNSASTGIGKKLIHENDFRRNPPEV